jgi:GNAT superfamily N-acetyltransferase
MIFILSLQTDAQSAEAAFVHDQLVHYNRSAAPHDAYLPLHLILRDENGEIAGGLVADTYWGWLVVNVLWIREDARRLGFGSRLLQAAEEEALRRGCRAAHLDTMDFQAPEFYLKHGYEVWGILEDMPEGHRRIFLKKRLVLCA